MAEGSILVIPEGGKRTIHNNGFGIKRKVKGKNGVTNLVDRQDDIRNVIRVPDVQDNRNNRRDKIRQVRNGV